MTFSFPLQCGLLLPCIEIADFYLANIYFLHWQKKIPAALQLKVKVNDKHELQELLRNTTESSWQAKQFKSPHYANIFMIMLDSSGSENYHYKHISGNLCLILFFIWDKLIPHIRLMIYTQLIYLFLRDKLYD